MKKLQYKNIVSGKKFIKKFNSQIKCYANLNLNLNAMNQKEKEQEQESINDDNDLIWNPFSLPRLLEASAKKYNVSYLTQFVHSNFKFGKYYSLINLGKMEVGLAYHIKDMKDLFFFIKEFFALVESMIIMVFIMLWQKMLFLEKFHI